jgi:hypothetical protein
MDALSTLTRLRLLLIGRPISLPPPLLEAFPMLEAARWRSGGLPPRIGGWCLGMRSVAGITLGRTVFLAPWAPLEPRFLLHEFAHVRQFAGVSAFPIRYVWQSLRHGYRGNRFERDADAFAAQVLAERPIPE